MNANPVDPANPVKNSIRESLLRYWLAMNASAFDSAIHALATFCGVAGVSVVTNAVPAMDCRQLLALFTVMFARAILKYLDEHPLSKIAEDGEALLTPCATRNSECYTPNDASEPADHS